MRRWLIVVVAVLAVLDLAVLAMGYQARAGALPGWGEPEPAFTMLPPGTPSGTPSGSSTDATTDTITGPVLMAVDADGLVLRATRGACQERFANPAQVAVGSVSTGVTAVEIPALTEVLGVAILPDDHLRVSGLQRNEASEECVAVTFDSTDSGRPGSSCRRRRPASGDSTGTPPPPGSPVRPAGVSSSAAWPCRPPTSPAAAPR